MEHFNGVFGKEEDPDWDGFKPSKERQDFKGENCELVNESYWMKNLGHAPIVMILQLFEACEEEIELDDDFDKWLRVFW